MDILNKTFVTIGTNRLMDRDYVTNNDYNKIASKPTKGLWSSEYDVDDIGISDWHRHAISSMEDWYGSDDLKKHVIFKLCSNARILVLDDENDHYQYPEHILASQIDKMIIDGLESWRRKIVLSSKKSTDDFLRLKKEYGVSGVNYLNMDAILRDYDGIYVSDNFIKCHGYESFWRHWDVNSLVIFRLDIIQTIKADDNISDDEIIKKN